MDWTATPLGPRLYWPLALRLALDLMLASRFPMCVIWGEERILLYNDGYAGILGPRHPAALGRPVEESWPEIWPQIEPLIARTYAGCGYFQRTNPLLFAHPSEAEGDVIARELGETRSGLEQVDVRAAGGQTSPMDA